MSKVSVFDMAGNQVSETEISDAVFGIEPNEAVMHAMVVNYLANSVRVLSQHLHVQKYAAAAESHGDRRVQAMQDRVQSVLLSGHTAVLLSVLSQEITVIHLIRR